MTTPDIATTMHEAMNAENRRRELAGQAPGLGSLVSLPQPPSGSGVGLSDVPGLEVAGEGYSVSAPLSATQTASYGPARPVYAAAEVGGAGYPLGIAQTARRHVQDMGDGRLLVDPGPDGRAAGDSYVVVSPPATRPSLWARLTGKLHRH